MESIVYPTDHTLKRQRITKTVPGGKISALETRSTVLFTFSPRPILYLRHASSVGYYERSIVNNVVKLVDSLIT